MVNSPCSGLAAIDENPNRAYSEVDGMQLLLQYKVMNVGCCKVLLVRNFVILTW